MPIGITMAVRFEFDILLFHVYNINIYNSTDDKSVLWVLQYRARDPERVNVLSNYNILVNKAFPTFTILSFNIAFLWKKITAFKITYKMLELVV